MDTRSESYLAKVEPDLARVIRAAAQGPQPFVIVYGIRTEEAERQAVATGHSQTMHSRHLPDKNGLSAAVDVAAIIGGKISFAPGREEYVFSQIAKQIMDASRRLGVPVEWGGDWHSFKDWGHFQLPWSYAPQPAAPTIPAKPLSVRPAPVVPPKATPVLGPARTALVVAPVAAIAASHFPSILQFVLAVVFGLVVVGATYFWFQSRKHHKMTVSSDIQPIVDALNAEASTIAAAIAAAGSAGNAALQAQLDTANASLATEQQNHADDVAALQAALDAVKAAVPTV